MGQQVTAERISEAYRGLRDAKIELHECSEGELDARTILKTKESQLLMSGAIIGKNADARDAQLREALVGEHQAVEQARIDKAKAQLSYDLELMAVDELKLLIRLEEIACNGALE